MIEHRHPDGSFILIISLRGREFRRREIAAWIDKWLTTHDSARVRIGRGPGTRVVPLAESFSGPPEIDDVSPTRLALRWPVAPEPPSRESKHLWKDWMVLLVREFCDDHRGAKFEGLGSRVD